MKMRQSNVHKYEKFFDRNRYISDIQKIVSIHFLNGDSPTGTRTKLLEYGLDSLDFVELLLKLEDRYEIEISQEELDDAHITSENVTIEKIAKYLKDRWGP